ncbi:chromate transporter [Thermoanaerobacterium sp. RBIITD]|nr:chromate transporter [Thermoanaerobacterium sp. RBIITD]SNX53564.1 chromate transporter [Thermoanaerobacterium sp. RBIITD]
MIYLKLLFSFFKIGLFSFGGGYAMLPLIQQEVVNANNWLTTKEFINVVAISQVTPGPVAINTATYVGYKVAGIIGSTFATVGVVLPSVIIILTMSKFFFKFRNNKYVDAAFTGLRPAVVGLIAAAAILVAYGSFIDYKSVIIFLAAFIATSKYKVDPILMIILAGVIGFLVY